ncbi:MAG: hypothetical protein AB8G11_22595 [Saprospiraceae bacterium]
MKIDRYTKFILTVIAFCLVVLTLNNVDIFPKAYANDAMNYGGNYGLVPMNEDGSINVRLQGIDEAIDELDVNIVGIDTYDELEVNIVEVNTNDELKVELTEISTSDELDINIDEVGGWVVNGGKLPIEE